MTKQKKKGKIGTIIYWTLLFLYTAALIALAFIVLRDWNKYLAAYENSQPDKVIDSYMAEQAETKWDGEIKRFVAAANHPFQTDEECIAVVKNKIGSSLKYRQAVSHETNGALYNIYSGKSIVGSVKMEQDLSKAADIDIGLISKLYDPVTLCPWHVTGDSFDVSGYKYTTTIKATIPSTFLLKLNGHDIGSEYITETGLHYDVLDEYYDKYQGLPEKVTYTIDNLAFGTLEPEVYDRDGNRFYIDGEKDDSQFMVPCSEDVVAEMADFADQFIQPYLNYFGTKYVESNGQVLRKYIVDGCDISRRMTEFLDGAQWVHFFQVTINSKSFDGVSELGGGFYVIKMTVDATAYGEYKNVNEESQYTIVVRKTDSGIKAVAVT